MFDFREQIIDDPVPTARQILAAGGYAPVTEHLLFQLKNNADLIELQLDQTTDLRSLGGKRFIVFKSDRSYRFELNEKRIEWGASRISGKVLKDLSSLDAHKYDVFEDRHNETDRKIENDEFADLTSAGVERFYSLEKAHGVQVKIDNNSRSIKAGAYVVSHLKTALGVPADKELEQIVAGVLTPLADDTTVQISGGEQFLSHTRRGGSA